MDPFERLPTELISNILLFASDFVGLESLLTVSSRARAVFHDRPGLFFQELVELNSIASAAPIKTIIQKVLLLHNPSFDFHSLEEYIQCTESFHDQPRIYADGAEVLQMMPICVQIQRLACKCLQTMQQNFISVVGVSPAGPLSGSIRAQKAAKPFSWVEESNMYWALWHLRHYSDLHNYASRRNWPPNSMKRLKEYHRWNSVGTLTAEVISTVAAVLSDLGLSPIYSYPYLGEHDESIQGVWWYPSETPPPLFHSFDLERSMDITTWPLPPTPPDDIVTDAWQLDEGRCGKTPGHMEWYKNWARILAYQGPHPNYTMIRIQPYRRVGVFIWDLWRMYSTGLVLWNYREPRIRAPDWDAALVELVGVQPVPMEEWHARWFALAGDTC